MVKLYGWFTYRSCHILNDFDGILALYWTKQSSFDDKGGRKPHDWGPWIPGSWKLLKFSLIDNPFFVVFGSGAGCGRLVAGLVVVGSVVVGSVVGGLIVVGRFGGRNAFLQNSGAFELRLWAGKLTLIRNWCWWLIWSSIFIITDALTSSFSHYVLKIAWCSHDCLHDCVYMIVSPTRLWPMISWAECCVARICHIWYATYRTKKSIFLFPG